MKKFIEPVENAATRGAMKEAKDTRRSLIVGKLPDDIVEVIKSSEMKDKR